MPTEPLSSCRPGLGRLYGPSHSSRHGIHQGMRPTVSMCPKQGVNNECHHLKQIELMLPQPSLIGSGPLVYHALVLYLFIDRREISNTNFRIHCMK